MTSENGVIARYGTHPESRVLSGSAPTLWFLSELEDPNSNRIRFDYAQLDSGLPYLVDVIYSFHSTSGSSTVGEEKRVHFVYELRSDVSTSFQGGVKSTLGRRAKEIQVLIDGQIKRRLALRYAGPNTYSTERSRLEGVTAFGDDCTSPATTSGCTGLPEITFAYTDFPASDFSSQWPEEGPSSLISNVGPFDIVDGEGDEDRGWRIGDVDGDGLVDLVRSYEEEGMGAYGVGPQFVYLNTGSGFALSQTWSASLSNVKIKNPHVIVARSGDNITNVTVDLTDETKFVWSGMFFTQGRSIWEPIQGQNRYLAPIGARLADVNADGRADLVASFITGAAKINCAGGCTTKDGLLIREVFLNTGTGWARSTELSDGLAGLPPFHSLFIRENETGQGDTYLRIPAICIRTGSDGCMARLGVYNGGVKLADVDGDGRLDAFARQVASFGPDPGARLLDGGWLQTPLGFERVAAFEPPVAHSFVGLPGIVDIDVRYVDVNGDRLADVIFADPDGPGGSSPGVWLSTGTGWCGEEHGCATASYLPPEPFLRWGIQGQLISNQVVLLDLNGDGLIDVLRNDASDNARRAWLQSPGTPERWRIDPHFKPPKGVSFSGTAYPYRSRGVLIADFDGNGTPDFIRSYWDGVPKKAVWRSQSTSRFADRLAVVDTGQGGLVEFEYTSLVEQRDASLEAEAATEADTVGESLPGHAEQRSAWTTRAVVAASRISGIDSDVFSTQYRYADPRWDFVRRIGLGVRLTEVTHPDDAVELRFAYQDHGRTGRLSRSEIFEGTNSVRFERHSWEVLAPSSAFGGSYAGIIVGRLASKLGFNRYESGPGGIEFAEFHYDDSYGFNFLKRIDSVRSTGTTSVIREPAPVDSANWIAGRPASERLERDGVVYRHNVFQYAPGTTLVSKRTATVQNRSPNPANGSTAYEEWTHDVFGNQRSHTDIKGRTQHFCFDGDAACHAPGTSTHSYLAEAQDPLGGRTKLTADAISGVVRTRIDFNGDVTSADLDPFGRPLNLTLAPLGDGVPITLEIFSYEDDPAGVGYPYVTSFVFDGTDFIRRSAFFDGLGNVVKEVVDAPNPGKWIGISRRFDHAGRIVRETLPMECSDWHCSIPPTPGVDEAIVTSHDAMGRPLLILDEPPGRVRAFAYGSILRSMPGASATRFDSVMTMDPNGNVIQHVLGGTQLVWTDECSLRVSASAPSPLAGVVCPSSAPSTFYRYDPTGEIGEIRDAEGNITVFQYDTLGRTTRIDDPNAGVRSFAYDLALNTLRVQNARQQGTEYGTVYAFDVLDRLHSVDRPNGPGVAERDIAITYDDDLGDDGSHTRGRKTVTETNGYDAAYLYDGFGRLNAEIQTAAGVTLRADYEYDLLGRITRVRYPAEETEIGYFYDGNYLKEVCGLKPDGTCYPNKERWIKDVTYDDLGRLSVIDFFPGRLEYSYQDPHRRLSRMRFVDRGGNEELDLAYSYDPIGNLVQTIDQRDVKADGVDATGIYEFDPLNRLTRFSRDDTDAGSFFRYDILGNLIGRDLPDSGAEPNQFYDHPTKPNALTSVVGGGTYDYDADGNRIRKTLPSQYLNYDSDNRLTCIGTSEHACEIGEVSYDVDGRRIASRDENGVLRIRLGDLYEHTSAGGTAFIYAFGQRVGERFLSSPVLRTAEVAPFPFEIRGWGHPPVAWMLLTGGGLLALVLLGGGRTLQQRPLRVGVATCVAISVIPAPLGAAPPCPGCAGGEGINRWYIPDRIGSSVLVIAANGAVIHRRVFEPFGKLVAQSPNPTESSRQIFTGQEFFAGAGLYDFNARWYDPQVGRFLSVDPVIADAGDPQTLNAFSYVNNRPLNFVDPTGTTAVGADPYTTVIVVGVSVIKQIIDWFGGEDKEDKNWCGQGSVTCRMMELLIRGGHDLDDLVGLSPERLAEMLSGTHGGAMQIDFKWIVDLTPARDPTRLAHSQARGSGDTIDGMDTGSAKEAIGPVEAALAIIGGVRTIFSGLRHGLPAAERWLATRGVGGAGPVRLGQIGEELAGIAGPKTRIPSLSGTARFRVPDELTATTLREVKNVQRLQTGGRAGQQLQDFSDFSRLTGRQCVLCVRQSTQISPSSQQFLDDLGFIVERKLP